jgi:hypothetical protein
MKTIFLKSGPWVTLALVFSTLVLLLQLNLVNRVDEYFSRQEFEEFLNCTIAGLLQPNSSEDPEQLPLSDLPDQAALQDYLNTIDPNEKHVPRERLRQAYDYTRALEKEPMLKSGSNLQWQGTVANFGGRVRAVMWDPNDPQYNKVWAGGVTGGLWYKENITNSAPWLPVDDFWPGLSVSCMTFDPNDPTTFYVGTGEAQTALIIYRESSGLGYGIQRSEDGGESWSVMPGTENFEYVTDIAVRDEAGTSVIYAAVVSGLYKGAVHQSEPSDGLFRSVVGSDLWEQVLPLIEGMDNPYSPSDIEVGPDGRIFVGTMPNVEGFGGATILYSDSGDPGSWNVNDEYRILIENTPALNLPGRVILASAPSDANRVYALIAQGVMFGIPAYECHIITRSDDKGESWEMVNIPPDNGTTGNWAFIAWHALTAGVDPNNPDRIYAGALNVYRSEDGGETWSTKSNWSSVFAANYVHADQHRILYEPGSSDRMLVATDGGIFYSVNASVNSVQFTEKNQGLNTLQMYKIALHPSQGTTFFLGGMQDNGTIYYDGNPIENLNRMTGGDGGACFIDQDEPNILITSYQNNRFFMINNGQVVGSATQWASGNFISSIAYDFRLNTLYANAVTVVNGNPDQILRISGIPDPPYEGTFLTMGTGSTVPFTHVKYSEYSPVGTATLYLGTQAGRLFKVDNAESTPLVTEIGSNDFPTASISCVATGGSEDTLLITFSNYGVSSVWQSYDSGSSWEEKEGNLPDMPVRWVLYHPDNAAAAMLATEVGIWTCYNLDEETPVWQPDNQGLANVRIDMLQLRTNDNAVLAGTHGRGFYHTTFNYNPTVDVNNPMASQFQVYPNPSNDFVTIQLNGAANQQTSWEVLNPAGTILLSGEKNPDHYAIELDIKNLKSGMYFIRLKTGNRTLTKKIIKL